MKSSIDILVITVSKCGDTIDLGKATIGIEKTNSQILPFLIRPRYIEYQRVWMAI